MAEKWIQKAINPKHKGALHKALGVPEREKIPAKKMAFCIHLVGIWGLGWLLDLWCSFFLNFLDQLEYFLKRFSSQVRHDVVHECG